MGALCCLLLEILVLNSNDTYKYYWSIGGGRGGLAKVFGPGTVGPHQSLNSTKYEYDEHETEISKNAAIFS